MINNREKRFRTVREIMEHYGADVKPLTGEEAGKALARRLLAEFRKAMQKPK